ncbi:kinase-like domain-containing protein [Sporodiniella umbellata]|nr:kinase-like domain-containing protein [Sporodiniella umbellata]
MSNSNSSRIQIGHYNVISTLGTGSFGKVKLAVHDITGQKVALKFLNRKAVVSMNMKGRVKREIQYLKLLRHPHIIKLYEVITTPLYTIMVIEYAGKELFNYIVEKGKMSEEDARRFFQQIICAVEYCHRHKIVHRDLKPENLMLDANNNVKIADFGLSNFMKDGDFLKTSCGSPNYAAPEVISGKLYAGPEVDVWSCGVILYVMLCGRLPFDDEYIPTLFKKINGGIYKMPSHLSSETKELLMSMLVVDPLKRITIQEIRKNEWFNKNLPDYLKPLPHTEESETLSIDEGLVYHLSQKMNEPFDTINKALKEPKNNQYKIHYQLLSDNRRLLKDSEHDNMQSFLATSPPPWNTSSTRADEVSEDSSISVLSSSLPKTEPIIRDVSNLSSGFDAFPGTPPPGVMEPPRPSRHLPTNTPKKPNKSRTRWHFGIRSKCPGWEVMLEIYRSLQNVGMEWRTMDPYHLRCRYKYPDLGVLVKFDLQLYKLENNSYLVDFKNTGTKRISTEGKEAKKRVSQSNPFGWMLENEDSAEHMQSIYPFLDVCSKLIADIV